MFEGGNHADFLNSHFMVAHARASHVPCYVLSTNAIPRITFPSRIPLAENAYLAEMHAERSDIVVVPIESRDIPFLPFSGRSGSLTLEKSISESQTREVLNQSVENFARSPVASFHSS